MSVFAPVAAIRQALSALMPEVEWATELRETPRNDRETTRVESLSRRESELWPLLARGLTLREAALRLEISYKTADSYRTNLLRKLGLRNRMELARLAIRLGMMPA